MTRIPGRGFSPQVIINPNFNRGQGAVQPQSGQSNEPIDVQLARSLLLDPKITDSHRLRLQQIIATSGNDDSKKQFQQAGQAVFNSILRAGADPQNPMTVSEAQEARKEFDQVFGVLGLPSPPQLRKAADEEDNPLLEYVNTIQTLAKQHGQSADYVQSLLVPDPRTGKVSSEDRRKTDEHLRNIGKPTSAQVSAIGAALTAQSKIVENLRSDPELFDQNTGQLLPDPGPTLFGNTAASDRYSTKLLEFTQAQQVRDDLLQRQRDIALSGSGSSFQPSASASPAAAAPSLPAASPSPDAAATAAGASIVTSQADYDKVPIGEPYWFNGVFYPKKGQ